MKIDKNNLIAVQSLVVNNVLSGESDLVLMDEITMIEIEMNDGTKDDGYFLYIDTETIGIGSDRYRIEDIKEIKITN